ncbi:hypothetical protein ACMD2_01295 [Ananas comosus]|uniref:Methyltransferase type 11 domain-containing protein n=1 Tax=Ananas comosus TaxID=4615 RepID=A0A199VA11_ANACO|nr:hypothetical protein ACMD2_01295 [Ananas comosus]
MDDHPRKPTHTRNCTTRSNLKIVLLLVSTNLVSIFFFSGVGSSALRAKCIHLWDSEALLRELNATKFELSKYQSESFELHKRLGPTAELKLAVGPHKLPLGYTANLGADELYPTLGTACRRFQDELEQYMRYDVGGECPPDDVFAQRLMLKGCEPLPRRRCHPKTARGYVEPVPFPASLWTIPPDTSIVWDAYTCKNYSCLVNRNKEKAPTYTWRFFKDRWLREIGELDYSIDGVLSYKPSGTVRIGLDIGGGTATWAARMRERNVTVVTSSMNFDGPFNSFIASRGLVPMHISVAHRLPFFDNTLDIVHSMHVLSNWIPDVMLEFALYDIFRVLRPGGLFWLDHFFCVGDQMNATYVPMFDRIGFRRLRWNAGRKLDRGIEKNEWYLSALLEKPMT